MFSVVLTS